MSSARVVLAAHGSADPRYPWVIEEIATAVRRGLRGHRASDAEVRIGYLEHCAPWLGDVVAPGDVVVPLLLSTGYHAAVDLPTVVGPDCVVAATLGPDRRLARACAQRLRAAGWRPSDPGDVVLAAAGSADPAAAHDVGIVAAWLAADLDREVVPAYLSATSPRLADVAGGAGAVATYLIAPGRFADQAVACGAPVVGDVLAGHPALVEVVVERALAGLCRTPAGTPVRAAT